MMWIKQEHIHLNSNSSWWCPQKQQFSSAHHHPPSWSTQAWAQHCALGPTPPSAAHPSDSRKYWQDMGMPSSECTVCSTMNASAS